jgi:hypothetical protein
MMQYKLSPNDKMWSSKEGLAIRLWKSDDKGRPKLPNRVPKLIPFHPIWGNDVTKAMEKQNFILVGILKYLEFWKLNMLKDPKYSNILKPYIDYWEVILEIPVNLLPQQSQVLLESLWPTSNWRVIIHNLQSLVHLSLRTRKTQCCSPFMALKA